MYDMEIEDLILFTRFNLVNNECIKNLIKHGRVDPDVYFCLPDTAMVRAGPSSLKRVGYPFNLFQLCVVYERSEILAMLVENFPTRDYGHPISDGLIYNCESALP